MATVPAPALVPNRDLKRLGQLVVGVTIARETLMLLQVSLPQLEGAVSFSQSETFALPLSGSGRAGLAVQVVFCGAHVLSACGLIGLPDLTRRFRQWRGTRILPVGQQDCSASPPSAATTAFVCALVLATDAWSSEVLLTRLWGQSQLQDIETCHFGMSLLLVAAVAASLDPCLRSTWLVLLFAGACHMAVALAALLGWVGLLLRFLVLVVAAAAGFMAAGSSSHSKAMLQVLRSEAQQAVCERVAMMEELSTVTRQGVHFHDAVMKEFCGAVLFLTDDLTICRSQEMTSVLKKQLRMEAFESFLGKKISGQHFKDLICEQDRRPLEVLLTRLSSLHCAETAVLSFLSNKGLVEASAIICQLQTYYFETKGIAVSDPTLPRYMVGLKIQREPALLRRAESWHKKSEELAPVKRDSNANCVWRSGGSDVKQEGSASMRKKVKSITDPVVLLRTSEPVVLAPRSGSAPVLTEKKGATQLRQRKVGKADSNNSRLSSIYMMSSVSAVRDERSSTEERHSPQPSGHEKANHVASEVSWDLSQGSLSYSNDGSSGASVPGSGDKKKKKSETSRPIQLEKEVQTVVRWVEGEVLSYGCDLCRSRRPPAMPGTDQLIYDHRLKLSERGRCRKRSRSPHRVQGVPSNGSLSGSDAGVGVTTQQSSPSQQGSPMRGRMTVDTRYGRTQSALEVNGLASSRGASDGEEIERNALPEETLHFEGLWKLENVDERYADWLRGFFIKNGMVSDATGDTFHMKYRDGEILLENGRLYIEDGRLHRLGRSGTTHVYSSVQMAEDTHEKLVSAIANRS